MQKKFVLYRETKAGIIDPLREVLAEIALKNVKLKLEALKADKKSSNYFEMIDGFITGFDDDCLSVILGVVYHQPGNELDQSFKEWILKELFEHIGPDTWDLSYYSITFLDDFSKDFRIHKNISVKQ